MSLPSQTLDPAQKRVCLLVIGMHRSGTSAVTHVLSLLGAGLPQKLLGATPGGNPLGHWEAERLIVAHDALLAEAGSAWDDWQSLSFQDLAPERLAHHKAQLRQLIAEEYGDKPLFVLKDPRVCRFVPLYIDVLAEMGIAACAVITFRNPLEVAASLLVRNGMPKVDGMLLWLRNVLDAERGSRGLPRVILGYDRLLAEGVDAVGDLGTRLGVSMVPPSETVAAEIENAVRRDLRHHKIGADELCRDPLAAGWIADTFAALLSLANDEADAAARSTLDRVAVEFGRATPWLATQEAAAQEAAAKASEAQVRQTVAPLNAEVARLESTLKAREADVVAAQLQYDTLVGSRPWRLASALASSYAHLPSPVKRALEWVFDRLSRR